MKPAVDRLEHALGNKYLILRIDVHSTLGSTLRNEYETRSVPSFILFSSVGEEIYRSHNVPDLEIINSIINTH